MSFKNTGCDPHSLGVDTLAVESYTVFIERTFLNMCAVPSKIIFCNISTSGVPGSCLIWIKQLPGTPLVEMLQKINGHLSLVFVIIPKFPITTGMTTVFMFHIRFICIARSLYLDNFQLLSEPYFVQMELRYPLCSRSLIDDLSLLYLAY